MFNIEYFTPEDNLLSKYIEYYYFLQSNQGEKHNFTYFPHFRTTLNVFLHADIKIEHSNMILNHNNNATINTTINTNKLFSRSVFLNGKHSVIGIAFKPLGINNFIKKDLVSSTKDLEFFDTTNWCDFMKNMIIVFETKSNLEKTKLLDNFLKNEFHPFKYNKLQDIIDTIIINKGLISISELEHQFSISRRSILRLFKKHLCCSVVDFKRIVKFRNLLDASQNKEKSSLTNLSLENNYYDQSDFINQFKSITGKIPSKVLSNINQIGKKDIFWLLNN